MSQTLEESGRSIVEPRYIQAVVVRLRELKPSLAIKLIMPSGSAECQYRLSTVLGRDLDLRSGGSGGIETLINKVV